MYNNVLESLKSKGKFVSLHTNFKDLFKWSTILKI